MKRDDKIRGMPKPPSEDIRRRDKAIFAMWDLQDMRASEIHAALKLNITKGRVWAIIRDQHRTQHYKGCQCLKRRGHTFVPENEAKRRLVVIRKMRRKGADGRPKHTIEEVAHELQLSVSWIHALMKKHNID